MPTFLSKNDKRRSGFGSCMAVAIMMGPSLAYGSPACMTQSEARAKVPKAHLYGTAENIAGMIVRHSVLAHPRQCPRLRHDPHKRQCPRLRWSSVSRSKRSAAHCWATPHKRQSHDPHPRQCPRLPHDPQLRQCPDRCHDPHPRQCPCLPFDPYRRQKGQDRNVNIRHVSKDPEAPSGGHVADARAFHR